MRRFLRRQKGVDRPNQNVRAATVENPPLDNTAVAVAGRVFLRSILGNTDIRVDDWFYAHHNFLYGCFHREATKDERSEIWYITSPLPTPLPSNNSSFRGIFRTSVELLRQFSQTLRPPYIRIFEVLTHRNRGYRLPLWTLLHGSTSQPRTTSCFHTGCTSNSAGATYKPQSVLSVLRYQIIYGMTLHHYLNKALTDLF